MSLRAFARVCVIQFFTSESYVLLFLSPTLIFPVDRHRGLVQRLSTSSTPSTPKNTKYNLTADSTPCQATQSAGFWKGNLFSVE